MFRPLPVREPDQLIFFTQLEEQRLTTRDFPIEIHRRFREENRTLLDIAAYDGTRVSATIDGQPEMIRGEFVTANYFDVMGVGAAAGRTLHAPGDEHAASVTLSYAYWQRRFGADPAVVGRTIRLGGVPCTIVGVAEIAYRGRRTAGVP